MYTPAQQAAIRIVATVPATVQFGVLPVVCEDLHVGFVGREYVDELTQAAKDSPAQPVLEFGPPVRGGAQMGLLPTICMTDDREDAVSLTMAGRKIEVVMSIPGDFMALVDSFGAQVDIEMEMVDAVIAAMQTLKARAGI